MKKMTDRSIRELIQSKVRYAIYPETITLKYSQWRDIVGCLYELIELRHENRVRKIKERKNGN